MIAAASIRHALPTDGRRTAACLPATVCANLRAREAGCERRQRATRETRERERSRRGSTSYNGRLYLACSCFPLALASSSYSPLLPFFLFFFSEARAEQQPHTHTSRHTESDRLMWLERSWLKGHFNLLQWHTKRKHLSQSASLCDTLSVVDRMGEDRTGLWVSCGCDRQTLAPSREGNVINS